MTYEQQSDYLRRHYATGDMDQMAAALGIGRSAMQRAANRLGIKRSVTMPRDGFRFTEEQKSYMLGHINEPAEQVAAALGLRIDQVANWRKTRASAARKQERDAQETAHVAAAMEAYDRGRIRAGLAPRYRAATPDEQQELARHARNRRRSFAAPETIDLTPGIPARLFA